MGILDVRTRTHDDHSADPFMKGDHRFGGYTATRSPMERRRTVPHMCIRATHSKSIHLHQNFTIADSGNRYLFNLDDISKREEKAS